MTPTPPPADPRLDRLFVRYWDNTITADEAIDLNARLASDPRAREWFRWFCTQAVFSAEWVAVHRETDRPTPVRRVLTRRRVLAGVGAGLAATATGLWLLSRNAPTPETSPRFTLVSAYGQVATVGRGGQDVSVGAVIRPGETLATFGTNSMAVLGRADGSTVTLLADSSVTLNEGGIRLTVKRGAISAAFFPPALPGGPLLTLATEVAAVTAGGVAVLTLSAEEAETEIQVQHGQVSVADRSGTTLTELTSGDLLTVREDGEHSKERVARVPDEFHLNLNDPLPEGWHVGRRDETNEGAVLVPEWWYDPYHSAVLSQIRSHKPWARGLVQVFPDSNLTVRYRANRGGRGQVCLCVRTERTVKAATGVLEWNDRYEKCRPGEWKTMKIRAGDMLNCKEAPTFPPPWVGFLLIFNTYDADLGLRVADVRVSRPGEPADV